MLEYGNKSLSARVSCAFPHLYAEENFSFQRNTTIGVGGLARVAVFPTSAEECADLLAYLIREKIPYCFLGAGANVLPSDEDFEGVVVRFSRIKTQTIDGTRLIVGAGVSGGALCKLARGASLSGFEPFTGIPTSVGGGVAMNAGVADAHFEDVVEQVTAVKGGKIYLFTAKECRFTQKSSIFLRERLAVTNVVLKGKYAPVVRIEENTCFYRMRRSGLPKGRSMGCVFVNPHHVTAGKLIDSCGLKGAQIGGARVSDVHANFIINDGGTSRDVSELISLVKIEVQRKTGIVLREEIRRLPDETENIYATYG